MLTRRHRSTRVLERYVRTYRYVRTQFCWTGPQRTATTYIHALAVGVDTHPCNQVPHSQPWLKARGGDPLVSAPKRANNMAGHPPPQHRVCPRAFIRSSWFCKDGLIRCRPPLGSKLAEEQQHGAYSSSSVSMRALALVTVMRRASARATISLRWRTLTLWQISAQWVRLCISNSSKSLTFDTRNALRPLGSWCRVFLLLR